MMWGKYRLVHLFEGAQTTKWCKTITVWCFYLRVNKLQNGVGYIVWYLYIRKCTNDKMVWNICTVLNVCLREFTYNINKYHLVPL